MDGLHTLRDVATAYFLKFGSFDFRVIQRFLARARDQKLIVIPQTDLLRRTLSDEPSSMRSRVIARLRAIDLRLPNVDERLGALYQKLRFMFTRPALVTYGVLLGVGIVALFYQRGRRAGAEVLTSSHALFLPLFLVLFGLSVIVHELSHALACKHFGREVKAFGFTFMNRLVPSVYADVTDMWMSTRKARMAVSLAGPMSSLLIGSASAIAAWLLPPSAWSSFFWLFALFTIVIALGGLYPFLYIESDGYHILSDWLRIPALREHSRRVVRDRALALLQRRKTKPLTPDERTFMLYGVASIASITAIATGLLVIATRTLIP